MTVPTLFSERNYHGKPGAGDCDDFTILALSVLEVNNFVNNFVVLAGYNPKNPVHIYAATRINGKFHYLDLTNGATGRRPYPFVQHIPFTAS